MKTERHQNSSRPFSRITIFSGLLAGGLLLLRDFGENSMSTYGFNIVFVTLSGETITLDSLKVKHDLKLEEVRIDEYNGFLFPCMAPPWNKTYQPNTEVVEFLE